MALDGHGIMAHMPLMRPLVRQLIRAGTIAFAIILVLLATTGFHLHADHEDHDHHHADAHHDHDHADEADHDALPTEGDPSGADPDGHDGILFHSHGVLADLMSPHLAVALGADHGATTANHRPSRDAVPDHPARDIDPPPNKRVL